MPFKGANVRVRIIFRGLILFRLPETGADKGLIRAELISKLPAPSLPGTLGSGGVTHPPTGATPPATGGHAHPRGKGGPHEHNPQIQIIGDAPPPHDSVPKDISIRDTTIRIKATGGSAVRPTDSFINHVPKLSEVVANATDPKYRLAKPTTPNPRLIHTVVTVNRGAIRVKDVVPWDAGANPLAGGEAPKGQRPSSPAELKFLGSQLRAHMASECVVDIDDVERLEIDAVPALGLPNSVTPFSAPNLEVGPDMVEILVTNYTARRRKAVPWGMDFQWLFEAAGYPTTELGGPEMSYFEQFATQYDSAEFTTDKTTLLGGGTVGRPFPYVVTYSSLRSLSPLTDLWDRPLCVEGRD